MPDQMFERHASKRQARASSRPGSNAFCQHHDTFACGHHVPIRSTNASRAAVFDDEFNHRLAGAYFCTCVQPRARTPASRPRAGYTIHRAEERAAHGV